MLFLQSACVKVRVSLGPFKGQDPKVIGYHVVKEVGDAESNSKVGDEVHGWYQHGT